MIAALPDPQDAGGNAALAPHSTGHEPSRRDHRSLIDAGSPGAAFTWCEQRARRCVDTRSVPADRTPTPFAASCPSSLVTPTAASPAARSASPQQRAYR